MDPDRSLLYLEAFPLGTVWLTWFPVSRLYELRANGTPTFKDRTGDYAQAVSWLSRLLAAHGRGEFAGMRPAAACDFLGLAPIEPGPRAFYHL